MIKIFNISLWCLALWGHSLYAQSQAIKVDVVDEFGKPIPDVSIRILGIQDDAPRLTDKNGQLILDAEIGQTLVVSRFNSISTNVKISQSTIKVYLGSLDKVYQLGYDKRQSKKLSSASISGIGAVDIERSSEYNILNATNGLLSGVFLQRNNNESWNTTPEIMVRGRGSFTGNNVITLVDGIERDLEHIDREEIESIVVLKDAATLAAFGNRGADGIISLTTKRGNDYSLKTKLGYNYGVGTQFRIPKMANSLQYVEALNEALLNDGLPLRYAQSDIEKLRAGESGAMIPQVDWMDRMLRDYSINHDLNLAIDGSNDRMRYFVFANYTGNDGLFNQTNLNDGYSTQLMMDALKLRTNVEARISPSTVARMNLMGRMLQYNEPTSGSDISMLYNTPASVFPIRNKEGVWVSSPLLNNPMAEMVDAGYSKKLQRTLFADLTIDQDLSVLTTGLNAQLRIAYDNSARIYDTYSKNSRYAYMTPYLNGRGEVVEYMYNYFGNDTELQFNHGLEWQMMKPTVWGKIGYDRNWNNHKLSASTIFSLNKTILTGANNTYMYNDYIGQVGYNYKDTYLLDAVLTYGGSSKLTSGDKYQWYPAVSAAWIISNELFMQGNQSISHLKLRGSIGLTGMDMRLSYDMDKQFNGVGNSYIFVATTPIGGYKEGALPSKDIRPETELKSNIGLELELANKVNFEIDGFYNKRKNIRVSSSGIVSGIIGIGTADVFTGQVENYGGEISIAYNERINDFSFGIVGNASFANNKILNMEEMYRPHDYMRTTGNSIGRFYGLQSAGMYQISDFNSDGSLKAGQPISNYGTVQPGDVKYVDMNLDGIINDYDYTYQANSMFPELYYGINLNVGYKNVGLNARFQGVGRSTVSTSLSSVYHPMYEETRNVSEHYLMNRWTSDQPGNKYPRLTSTPNNNNFRESSLWTVSGDYFKLRNVEAHYTLSSEFLEKFKLQSCRLFVRGMNLFSIDQVGIMDPEYIQLGYPSQRTYLLGVNLLF